MGNVLKPPWNVCEPSDDSCVGPILYVWRADEISLTASICACITVYVTSERCSQLLDVPTFYGIMARLGVFCVCWRYFGEKEKSNARKWCVLRHGCGNSHSHVFFVEIQRHHCEPRVYAARNCRRFHCQDCVIFMPMCDISTEDIRLKPTAFVAAEENKHAPLLLVGNVSADIRSLTPIVSQVITRRWTSDCDEWLKRLRVNRWSIQRTLDRNKHVTLTKFMLTTVRWPKLTSSVHQWRHHWDIMLTPSVAVYDTHAVSCERGVTLAGSADVTTVNPLSVQRLIRVPLRFDQYRFVHYENTAFIAWMTLSSWCVSVCRENLFVNHVNRLVLLHCIDTCLIQRFVFHALCCHFEPESQRFL